MAASLWLLQLPLHSSLFLPSNHSSTACPALHKKHAPAAARGKLILCSPSGASSSVVTKEQEAGAVTAPSEEGSEPALVSYKDEPNFRYEIGVWWFHGLAVRTLDSESSNPSSFKSRGCKGCGRAEIERGCNGEGRIQGGIAAVPGFGWWPIKAYRPCPGFVASGGRYRRQGQSMDDVASGRGKKVPSGKKKSDK
ncbi:uncharacterized protein LOC133892133 isoform X1 [Phragmites australis]|uniref:uncharacterized protein LOC133892133 isoform X1 n=1 Tax=Phragmites australis TaxID=29695 RepID=UPI002D79B685|nr:uncharacterized protein LOC133892133 isoform X1 [Phragmites australis]